MTSAINTSGINVNFPVQGSNNSSQGFRSNSSNIVANFETASNEITALQNTNIQVTGAVTSNISTIETGNIVLQTTANIPFTSSNISGNFSSLHIVSGGNAGVSFSNGILTINLGN